MREIGLLAASLFLLCWLIFGEKKRALYSPPGPRPLPLLGNLLDMAGADPHIRLTEMARKFGTVFQVRFGREPVVVISDIDLAKEALVKSGDDFAGRAPLPTTDLLSNSGMGIAFADYGRGWRIHKKLTHNALKMFGQGMLQLEDKISQEADWLCGYLRQSSGRPLDPYLPLNTVVGNVISSICFGKRFEPEDEELKTIIGYNEGLVDTVGKDGLIDVFPWLAKLPNATIRKMKECLKTRDSVLNNNIEQHRVSYKDGKSEDQVSYKAGAPRDLVDALLKAQAEAVAEGGRKAQRYLSDDHILTTVILSCKCSLQVSYKYKAGKPRDLVDALLKAQAEAAEGGRKAQRSPTRPVRPAARDLVDALLKAQAETAAEGGRKAQRYLSDDHILTTVSYKAGKPRDLVDALLKAQAEAVAEGGRKAQRYLSDDHILTTVNDVFGGGMETSTTTLSWILAFLLHHPEVQTRIQEELQTVLCANDPLRLSDRERLPYLEATIREVLRMRPVAPLAIPHKTIRDTSVGDFDVPQGTRVMFNLWAIHHDERHWTDPATFNPARFLDPKTGQLVRGGSFLPFLAGCRGCLGESMAKAELFLFTARILRDFRLELPHGVSPPSLQGRYGVVMAPERFNICFRPRNAS
ncbi:steroid 17-alpha-hydroxylase/17,20 lyase-like [Branchiostoma floridae x Branchiostoma belcheri]